MQTGKRRVTMCTWIRYAEGELDEQLSELLYNLSSLHHILFRLFYSGARQDGGEPKRVQRRRCVINLI